MSNPTRLSQSKYKIFSGTVIYFNLVIEQPWTFCFQFYLDVGDFKADIDFQLDVIKTTWDPW